MRCSLSKTMIVSKASTKKKGLLVENNWRQSIKNMLLTYLGRDKNVLGCGHLFPPVVV